MRQHIRFTSGLLNVFSHEELKELLPYGITTQYTEDEIDGFILNFKDLMVEIHSDLPCSKEKAQIVMIGQEFADT